MKNKIAIITGITGQDGSYLAEFLLKKNYKVHGIKRKSSSFNTERIDKIFETNKKNFFLHYGDITDTSSLSNLVHKIKPNEIYNLAAQSHVATSFIIPEYTADVVALGTLRILEIIKNTKKKIKFYQASSSEMYGDTNIIPQDEKTIFKPMSPYATSKVFAHNITKNYREAYKIFASNGILFNHESPRRGETFVTRKITRAVADIYHGRKKKFWIGNLDAKRDWGHAKDYVEGMWKINNYKVPEDFVLATGKSFSVREFCEVAFKEIGVVLKWKGKGLKEKGYNIKNNKILIEVDKRYFRPTEVDYLLGDATKAKKLLKWKPKIKFKDLVSEMVQNDINNSS